LLLEARVTPPVATHIWLNGRLLPSDAAHLSAYDRGFQLGDGVFEALRARRGVAIELQGHIARLHRGLSSMGMEIPYGDEAIAAGISELLAAEGWDGVEPPGDAAIRLTISRGFDPTRGVAPHSDGSASVAIQAWPFNPPGAATLAEGLRLVTSVIRRDPSSPISGIKTTSRAELVYARLEAERAGADDAVFLTIDGRITEATTSNVLLIHGDVCATPRLGTGLLAGTARAWLVEHGGAVGLRTVEKDLRVEDALEADEAALCSSIAGVVPVVSLDGRPVGTGKPGPLTMALRAARESWIDSVSLAGALPSRTRPRL
jgi:branched-subunit amino acid aminotransferase/4-amino-4-deoxychorismate lyase